MAEQHNEPLISPQAQQTNVNMGTAGGDSSRRAFKVAGFTVLACALIAGQALTAYFLLSQKSQITSLEENTNSMKKAMSHRQSGKGSSAGMAMSVPMGSIAIMTDHSSEDPIPREETSIQKTCIQQAIEAGPNDFRPKCDEVGNYLPMQCQGEHNFCWCVDANGKMIKGTGRVGRANCGVRSAGVAHMALMPNMEEMKDE